MCTHYQIVCVLVTHLPSTFTVNTKVHSSHPNPYPAHNSHEAIPVVGEHTERLPAVPVGEQCTGLKGVGEMAAVKGNRATHLRLCAGSMGQLLSTYTCTYVDINTPYSTYNQTHAQSCVYLY